jgi:hypothetical protein
MKFATKIYTGYKEPYFSKNNIVLCTCFGIILLLGFLNYKNFGVSTQLMAKVMFTFTIIYAIIAFSAFFREEEHIKSLYGEIEINRKFINWNGFEFVWDEIKEINIEYFNYKGKLINFSINDYRNKRSAGVDNKLSFQLTDGRKFEGYLFISSEKKVEELKMVLWEVIKNNEISLNIAINLVHPSNYKEHQNLKKMIS